MATSRYVNTPRLGLNSHLGTSQVIKKIRSAVARGVLPVREITLRGVERLDTIAGAAYGDGRYWWILAAASDIGWGMQVPPGTIILIPDLAETLALL